MIAEAMGISSPPGRINTARYILGQPLQYAPGSTYAHSNIGYLLLSLIVEHVTAMDHVEYVHREVLTPLGVPESELELGRIFPVDRNPREP